MKLNKSPLVRAREWASDNAGPFAMGLTSTALGLGLGYFMWNDAALTGTRFLMAMLAAVIFALGGVMIMADALGYRRVMGRILAVVLWLMIGLVNFGVFTSPEVQCIQNLSLFGVPIVGSTPDPEQCRFMAIVTILPVDAVLLCGIGYYWWKGRSRSVR
jgi:hypothetical protein